LSFVRPLCCGLCLIFLSALTGCGISHLPTAAKPALALSGQVHGGQQPVSGASIQLYEVGTTADGSPSVALLTPAVTTDSGGGFNITGLYTCSPSTSLVYLAAVGGNPGLAGGVNPNLVLLTALGPCNNLTSSQFININEVTTVAAVAALAPFMSTYSAVDPAAGMQPI
jgi:trimeric autotransporter adhesin